jgi:hypothetical protein
MGALSGLRQRRAARRWQRWTEIDPEDDLHRRAGIGTAIASGLFLLLIGLVIVGFLVAR